MRVRSYKVVLIIGLCWLGSLIYLMTTSFPSVKSWKEIPIKSAELDNLAKELTKARQQFQELTKHAQELKALVAISSNNHDNDANVEYLRSKLKEETISHMERENNGRIEKRRVQKQRPDSPDCGAEPSLAYEKIRRKIDNGVTEIWYYMRSQLNQLKSSGDQKIKDQINKILADGGEQQRSIKTDIYNLSKVDGYLSWRRKEARELTKLVQQRLRYLQNPQNCSKAKKLVCDLKKRCGYGCQVHHIAYCMIVAYATQRTLILNSKGWSYSKEGWQKLFLPLSETCIDGIGDSKTIMDDPSLFEHVQVVHLVIIDSLRDPRPEFLPLAIPEDISKRLLRLHGHPIVWWVGQIMTYIQRPRPAFQEDIDKKKVALGFTNPIVGLHVRRTDKINTEAVFHGIEEYMFHAEEYYQRLERKQNVLVRKIYLATDDANLLKEAENKYPNYVFVSDDAISKSASLASRYSEESLRGVVLDIYFLSRCDFLVCTFSSQVCRAAYEMMQYIHEDAAANFRSLDDMYYFGGQNAHSQTVLYEHKPREPGEIEMLPGDTIGVAGNHWNGYSKGVNRRSGSRSGLYPSYKVEDKTDIVKMPTYPEAHDFHI